MFIQKRLVHIFVEKIEKKRGAKRWNNMEVLVMLRRGVLLQWWLAKLHKAKFDGNEKKREWD